MVMVTGYYGNKEVRGTYYKVRCGHGDWLLWKQGGQGYILQGEMWSW